MHQKGAQGAFSAKWPLLHTASGRTAKHVARYRRQDVTVLSRINYTQSLREGQAVVENMFLKEVKIATAIVLKILSVFLAKALFTHLDPGVCGTLWKSDSSVFVFTTVS